MSSSKTLLMRGTFTGIVYAVLSWHRRGQLIVPDEKDDVHVDYLALMQEDIEKRVAHVRMLAVDQHLSVDEALDEVLVPPDWEEAQTPATVIDLPTKEARKTRLTLSDDPPTT